MNSLLRLHKHTATYRCYIFTRYGRTYESEFQCGILCGGHLLLWCLTPFTHALAYGFYAQELHARTQTSECSDQASPAASWIQEIPRVHGKAEERRRYKRPRRKSNVKIVKSRWWWDIEAPLASFHMHLLRQPWLYFGDKCCSLPTPPILRTWNVKGGLRRHGPAVHCPMKHLSIPSHDCEIHFHGSTVLLSQSYCLTMQTGGATQRWGWRVKSFSVVNKAKKNMSKCSLHSDPTSESFKYASLPLTGS